MAYNYQSLASIAKKVTTYLASKSKNAKIKTSRYNSTIKVVEIDDIIIDIKPFLDSLTFPGTVSDLQPADEKAISGTYKAKLVTVNKPVPSAGLKVGDQFFILNVHTEKGSVKSKALAPSALGLDQKEYTSLDTFDKAVLEGISKLKVPSDVQMAITELYNDVKKTSSETSTVAQSTSTRNIFSNIKSQDKQAIGKDFGEVLSLRWYLTQPYSKGWTRFGFESGSNAALVDYYVVKKVK
jgi:hypothetical protein